MRTIGRAGVVAGSVMLAIFAGCGGDDDGGSAFDGGAVDPDATGSSSSSGFVPGEGGGSSSGGGGGVCGNGVLESGETCDDKNVAPNDGCGATCQVEPGYVCPAPSAPCAPATVCGDGLVQGAEQCDDGNAAPGDGCDATCKVQAGWVCPQPGAACFAARCGDGLVVGDEECDVGAAGADGGAPGCSGTCQLQEGYKCPTPNTSCAPTVCGDGVVEGTEQCDDGELVAGGLGYLRPYDGCSTTCKREPVCRSAAQADGGGAQEVGACQGVCGDGLVFPGEACDDGNRRAGDGCSATCQKEPGFSCTDVETSPPSELVLPLVIRDFRGYTAGANVRHPDFELQFMTETCGSGVVSGIVGPLFTSRLSADGKPVFVGVNGDCVHGQAGFDQWYRDVPGTNATLVTTLTLPRKGDGSYVFDSDTDEPYKSRSGFYPINGLLLGNQGPEGRNYHFTSELKYWFTYRAAAAPPVLEFRGDDDVFVYINGRLAVDVGGIHGPQTRSITLSAANATNLGLEDGKLYEFVVFQAERNRTGSNYKLTLRGFEQKRTTCAPICGDGTKTKTEVCDDGPANDTNGPAADAGATDGGASRPPAYGKCSFDCRARGGYCGDGVLQSEGGEVCDLGPGNGGYGPGSCAPGCKAQGPRCGDGVVQVLFGEECDDGNTGSNDGCSSTCKSESRIR